MKRYFDIENSSENYLIKCLEERKDGYEIKNVIVYCHGYTSNKENLNVNMLTMMMEEHSAAIVSYDLIGHGMSDVPLREMTLERNISDLDAVLTYVKETYNNAKIIVFGTSFGAYILLNRCFRKEDDIDVIILRSAAFNMAEAIEKELGDKVMKEWKAQGKLLASDAINAGISFKLYEEIKTNDVFKLYNNEKKIYVFHGTNDKTITLDNAIKFRKLDPDNIVLYVINNATHRMDELNHMGYVVSKTYDIIKKTNE